MTITELREKCKAKLSALPKDALILGILLLASSFSFGLGYLAGRDAGQGSEIIEVSPVDAGGAGQVMASKNGTKYYTPDCPGADRISEANKIWFVSAKAAEEAGYSLSTTCSGT